MAIYLALPEFMEKVRKAFLQGTRNILLVGDFGTGKSYLAYLLKKAAENAGVPVTEIGITPDTGPLELIETPVIKDGKTLGRWSQVVQVLHHGGVAVIEEMDKGAQPAYAALHQLEHGKELYSAYGSEPSKVLLKGRIIATANDLETIPESLRDRYQIVKFPDRESRTFELIRQNAFIIGAAYAVNAEEVLEKIYENRKETVKIEVLPGRKPIEFEYYLPYSSEKDIIKNAKELVESVLLARGGDKKILRKINWKEVYNAWYSHLADEENVSMRGAIAYAESTVKDFLLQYGFEKFIYGD